MVADIVSAERRESSPPSVHLCALLARALLLYTLEFERESALSLPLCANVVRVLEEAGVLVDEIPPRSGISKEATSMALTFLVRSGYVAVDGATSATKLARLTAEGRAARDACGSLHAALESGWDARFGADAVVGSAPRSSSYSNGAKGRARSSRSGSSPTRPGGARVRRT